MTNPFLPPTAELEKEHISTAGWLRVTGAILGFSLLSLILSWVAAPLLAGELSSLIGITSSPPGPEFLLIDLILSCAAFVLGCFLAARAAYGRSYISALGVAAVGWLVYFTEVGGLPGMLGSSYPGWYEFFPSHFGSALLAAYLATRQQFNQAS